MLEDLIISRVSKHLFAGLAGTSVSLMQWGIKIPELAVHEVMTGLEMLTV